MERNANTIQASLKNEDGFSLMEVIVVLAIIGLIMGIAGPMVMKQFSKAKGKTAAIQVKALKANMEFLYLDVGRYPTESEGLNSLLKQPASAPGWNGPYISDAASLIDPWGRPYLYKITNEGAAAYLIYSYGADGKEGGSGDDQDVYSSPK